MAFNREELANIGYNAAVPGQARTCWMYINSEDDNIDGSGFFNDAADDLRPGDFIIDTTGRKLRFVDTVSAEGVVALDDADVAAG